MQAVNQHYNSHVAAWLRHFRVIGDFTPGATREVTRKGASMAKVGSVCSILAGAIFAVSGVAFFLLAGHFDFGSIKSMSDYFRAAPGALTIFTVVNVGATLASFLAIAGVLALSDRIRPAHEGLVRWTSTLAIIGYAILATSDIADLSQTKQMVLSYAQIDQSAQSALEAVGIGSLDPTLFLRYITFGPWFLVAGWLSLRENRLPKVLAWLGVIAGIAALIFVIASFLDLQTLIMVTVTVTLVFHPLWLIWTGLELGQTKP